MAEDESRLEQTNIDTILTPSSNLQHFANVKNILFLAPSRDNVKFRCIHNKIFSDLDQEMIDDEDEDLVRRVNDLGGMMTQIGPLFQCLQDDYLHKFQ